MQTMRLERRPAIVAVDEQEEDTGKRPWMRLERLFHYNLELASGSIELTTPRQSK